MEALTNILENNNLINNINLEEGQNNFLQSSLGKVINVGLDLGLRAILPDLIESQVIEIKDTILSSGFKEGVNKAISSAVDLGKSALGIVTGNFENVTQVQSAVKNGGIIDNVSNLIDFVVDKTRKSGILPYNIATTIKKGKNIILNNISNNIENEFNKQIDNIEKLEKYNNNWKQYYQEKDFEGMTKEYKKIQEKIKELIPMENTLKQTRVIENLHNLIKNNGKNFNISDEEKKLANMLI